MTPAETFAVWRTEVLSELTATSAALATARSTLAAAEAAHSEARAAWSELEKFAAGAVPNNGSMSAPLYSRLMSSRDALTAAERTRGAARASVDSLTNRVSELQLALDQIDRAVTAAKVTPFPAAAEPRRKPAPVEFDNITMPKGAA